MKCTSLVFDGICALLISAEEVQQVGCPPSFTVITRLITVRSRDECAQQAMPPLLRHVGTTHAVGMCTSDCHRWKVHGSSGALGRAGGHRDWRGKSYASARVEEADWLPDWSGGVAQALLLLGARRPPIAGELHARQSYVLLNFYLQKALLT